MNEEVPAGLFSDVKYYIVGEIDEKVILMLLVL